MTSLDASTGCAFCAIIAGTSSAAVVDRDSVTITILDLRQPGWPDGAHLLVLPRQHVEVIDDLDDATGAALMASTVRAARLVRRVLEPDGINVWQSNNAAGGQEVPHVHVHVLSRQIGDGLLRIYPSPPTTPDLAELEAFADRLRGG